MLILNGSGQKIFKCAGSSKLFLGSAGYIGTIFKITNDSFLYLIEIFVFPFLSFYIFFSLDGKRFYITLFLN